MKTNKIAAIFDMDGVLVDSVGRNWTINNLALAEYGVNVSDELLSKYIGRSIEDQISAINHDYKVNINHEEFINKIKTLKDKSVVQLEPIPGAVSLVKKLHNNGYLIGLGTSNSLETTRTVLDSLGVSEFFNVLVTSEDVSNHKPDPEVYLKCSKLLGLNPGHCIVLEDAPSGIQAAKKAGMLCVALKSSYCSYNDLSSADMIINSLQSEKIISYFENCTK